MVEPGLGRAGCMLLLVFFCSWAVHSSIHSFIPPSIHSFLRSLVDRQVHYGSIVTEELTSRIQIIHTVIIQILICKLQVHSLFAFHFSFSKRVHGCDLSC